MQKDIQTDGFNESIKNQNSARLRGRLDVVQRDRISGWALNPAEPDMPVDLLVIVDNQLIARVSASRYRADLERAAIGDGRHSFELIPTPILSPRIRHTVEVRRESDGAQLPGSPDVVPAETSFSLEVRDWIATLMADVDSDEGIAEYLAYLRRQSEFLIQRREYLRDNRIEPRTSAQAMLHSNVMMKTGRALINGWIGGIARPSRRSIAPKMLRPVIVMGMHRSGTSALSGGLQQLGVYFGELNELLPANKWNERGHFEFAELVRLNDELLASLGSAWDAPPIEVKRKILSNPKHPLLARAGDICLDIQRRATQRDVPWGIKDPRFSLTWPFWKHLLPDARFMISIRPPLEVAASLRARNGLSIQLGMRLCKNYFDSLLALRQHNEVLTVSYATLTDRPIGTFKRICKWLDLPATNQAIGIAATSVQLELSHHRNFRPKENYLDDDLSNSYAKLAANVLAVEGNNID